MVEKSRKSGIIFLKDHILSIENIELYLSTKTTYYQSIAASCLRNICHFFWDFRYRVKKMAFIMLEKRGYIHGRV
jgi:hypothetical protein